MIGHRRGDNYFVKLDFVNSDIAPEFRCYYDQNNDDYIISKASLFYLLQRLSPNTGISRQIAMQSQLASGQFEDLSKMVSLKELTKSSQISPIQLEKIRQNIYCLDYDAWFKVSQNGEIILTKKMLLEALQQVSKSRDEKFFSEHFSYIAKDFDPSQPSQYSAQSFEEYKDWLVGLNKDRILQINIEQLKIDCQNGRAGERINLQNFLAKSKLESNLLNDINNYFMDNLFMTKSTQGSIEHKELMDKLGQLKKLYEGNSDDVRFILNNGKETLIIAGFGYIFKNDNGTYSVNITYGKSKVETSFSANTKELIPYLDKKIQEKTPSLQSQASQVGGGLTAPLIDEAQSKQNTSQESEMPFPETKMLPKSILKKPSTGLSPLPGTASQEINSNSSIVLSITSLMRI